MATEKLSFSQNTEDSPYVERKNSNVLVMQFRDPRNEILQITEERERFTELGKEFGNTVKCVNILSDAEVSQIPWNKPQDIRSKYGKFIIAGSSIVYLTRCYPPYQPLIERSYNTAGNLIQSLVDDPEINTLGICFGFQLMTEIAGGELAEIETEAETGMVPLLLNDAGKRNPLFRNLEDKNPFYIATAHGISLQYLPAESGFITLGSSLDPKTNNVYNNIAVIEKGKVVGIQAHPELTDDMLRGRINHVGKNESELMHTETYRTNRPIVPVPYAVMILQNFYSL